nr:MAG: 2-octaprenyl-6-methoxyphenyl hydroxylase [Hyphomicrobiales bacterium]
MVGLCLALGLARGGLRVTIVEPVTARAMTDDRFDGRVSALAFAGVRMLGALGVWQHLEPNAQPINDILISDGSLEGSTSPLSLHFDHREIGEPLGHIAENRDIRASLFAAIEDEPRISLLTGVKVENLVIDGTAARATLSSGARHSATVCVAADGRDSALREGQEIRTVGWDYPQTGIVATVAHERPHNGVAYEHFLPSGPFAILPMTGNRSSLVWTEKSKIAATMMTLGEREFAEEIAKRFGDHLGEVTPQGRRWAYPLRLELTRTYVKKRFALVGDAAHTIHPIAGQGFNLGLKDVAALAETILDAARLGLDFGEEEVLKRYERWRRLDSFVLAAATDGVNRLFSNDLPPLRLARDLGLGIVDKIAPLRRFFMRHAGGDIGRLPKLLKGEAA